MRDIILDFIEGHRKLVFGVVIFLLLLVVILAVRSNNLKRKALLEEEQRIEEEIAGSSAIVTGSALEQDVEPAREPESKYRQSLGLDADKGSDGRVQVAPTPVAVEPATKQSVEPVKPKYPPKVIVFDHTVVPERNMDGSSCKAYQAGVSIKDFDAFGGSSLTADDMKADKLQLVGVKQNQKDFEKGDLESTGWLISNLDKIPKNKPVKFTNLHVIGSLSDKKVSLLCSYDWYSAFGLKDTLVYFEDISGTLSVKDFKDGDIFSAIVYRHNISTITANGQKVLVVKYAVFN